MGKLNQKRLDALTKTKGRFGDGDGLFFRSFGAGKAYWVYRYRTHGCEREMSLGPYPEVDLGAARAKHVAARKQVITDKADPLAARDAERAKRNGVVREGASGVPTFGQMADRFVAAHEGEWVNAKHRWQWSATLTNPCAAIRDVPVDKVHTKAVLSVLSPIWTQTPETASRLRGRIEKVLAAAQVAGHIDPDMPSPARWKNWLGHMLANPKKIGERGNHAAMDWKDVPAFVATLRGMDTRPQERPFNGAILVFVEVVGEPASDEPRGDFWMQHGSSLRSDVITFARATLDLIGDGSATGSTRPSAAL